MEENTHISYFKVENFKRFESFEMENIGQFNLIVGDNNVGKTTVLEALLFDENMNEYVARLFHLLDFRHIHANRDNLVKLFAWYFNQKKTVNKISYAFENKSNSIRKGISFEIIEKNSLNDDEIKSLQNIILLHPNKNQLVKNVTDLFNTQINFFDSSKADSYTPFVSVNSGYDDDLADYYSKSIQPSSNKKRKLIDDIRLFIPEIWDIEISSAVLEEENFIIARHSDFDKPLPITMFGEGSVKLLRILLEINMCGNARLMIDEIDTGIYHKRFKHFWKIILLSTKKNNVQLFATTHSKECLNFIKEVFEEDEELKIFQKDMRCFRLVEQKDKSVKSYCYDFEQFQFAINHENEIR